MNSSGSDTYKHNPHYQQRFFNKSKAFNSKKRQQKSRPHHDNSPYANMRDHRFSKRKFGRGGHPANIRQTPPPGSPDAMQRIVQKTSSYLIRELEASTDGEIILPASKPQEPEDESLPSVSTAIIKPPSIKQVMYKAPRMQATRLSEREFIAKFDEIFAQLSLKQKQKVVNNGSNTPGLKFYRTAVLRELKNVSHKNVELQQCHVANEIMPELVMELEQQSREFIAQLSETLDNTIDLDEFISDKEDKIDITAESDVEVQTTRITESLDPPPAPKVTAEELEQQRCAVTEMRNIQVVNPVPSVAAEEIASEKPEECDFTNIKFEVTYEHDRSHLEERNAIVNARYTIISKEPSEEQQAVDRTDAEKEDVITENITLRNLRRKFQGSSDVESDAVCIVLERAGSECASDHYSDTEYNPNLIKTEKYEQGDESSSNGVHSIDEDTCGGPEPNLEQHQPCSVEDNTELSSKPTVITIIGPADGAFKATTAKLLPEINDENHWRDRYIKFEVRTRRMLAELKALDDEYARKRTMIINEYNNWTNSNLEIQQCPSLQPPQLIPEVIIPTTTPYRHPIKYLKYTIAENETNNHSAVINCLEASSLNDRINECTKQPNSLNDRLSEASLPPRATALRSQMRVMRYSFSEDDAKNRNTSMNSVESTSPNDRINEAALSMPTSRTHVKTMTYSISEDDVKRRNPVINSLEATSPNERMNDPTSNLSSPTDFASITDLFTFPSAAEGGVVSKAGEHDMDDSNRIIDALNNYGDLTFPDILTAADAFVNNSNHGGEKSGMDFPQCHNIKVEKSDESLLTYIQLRPNPLPSQPGIINFRDWTDSVIVMKVFDNEVIAGHDNGLLSYYNIESGNLIQTMRLSAKAITSIILLDMDKDVILYIGSLDGNLHIVNLKTRNCMRKLPIRKAIQCLEVAWNTIFIGTTDGEIIRYLYRQNGLKQSNKIADNGILAMNSGMDGARHVLIVAIRDAAVSICDALSGMTLRVIGENLNPTVYSMLFFNNRIYCGTSHHNVLVYNYHDAQLLFRHEESQGSGIPCIKRLHHLLFVGCFNRRIYVYNMQNNSLITSIAGPEGILLSMEVTGNKIIVSTKEHFQCLPLPTSVLGLI